MLRLFLICFVADGLDITGRERESLGSVPNAVSPASKAGPRMPMRDMPEHEKETERARHGHSLTLHVDIVTSCGMGDLHVDGKRVSCDLMISNEIQVRKGAEAAK